MTATGRQEGFCANRGVTIRRHVEETFMHKGEDYAVCECGLYVRMRPAKRLTPKAGKPQPAR